MQHTTNYNLNQWEDGDVVRREDFNADNAAIDAALKSVSDASPELVFGHYIGNGEASRIIELGRQPKAVFVQSQNGRITDSGYYYGGFAIWSLPLWDDNNNVILAVQPTGFKVCNKEVDTSHGVRANYPSKVYHYAAFF